MSQRSDQRVHRPVRGQCRQGAGALVLAIVAALLLAGCGADQPVLVGGSDSSDAAPTPTAPSGTAELPGNTADSSPGAAVAAGVDEPAPTGTGPIEQSVPPSPSGQLKAAVVKDIRAARHPGFDRVVVQYQGTFGAWRVAYADRIVEDPTGEPVPLRGSAFLSVVVQNATFDNLVQVGDGVPRLVYDGPRRLSPDLPNVFEIADAGDFEAVMALGIGLDHAAGLRAYRLEDPSRLVIDVAH